MTDPDKDWNDKTLCALRWIVMLNILPLLNPESRKLLKEAP